MGNKILMALAIVLVLLNGVSLAEKSQDSDEITAKPNSREESSSQNLKSTSITEVRVSSSSTAGIGDRSSLQSSFLGQKIHEKHDLTSPKSFEIVQNNFDYNWRL